MKKYLIFDFDGLILDTEYAWYLAYKQWFMEYYQFELDLNLFISCVGTTNHKFLEECSRLLEVNIDPKQFKEETNRILFDLCSTLSPVDGVYELLNYAKSKSIVCSIVSNSPKSWSIPHLIRNEILDKFDLIITPLIRDEMKPSSLMYKKLMRFYDSKPEEILVLEDSPSGLKSAVKAGLDVAIIENRLTKYMVFEDEMKYKFKSLKEVIKAL